MKSGVIIVFLIQHCFETFQNCNVHVMGLKGWCGRLLTEWSGIYNNGKRVNHEKGGSLEDHDVQKGAICNG